MTNTENTHSNLSAEEKEKVVMKEMLPYFLFAALPIILTILIAKVFGPSH